MKTIKTIYFIALLLILSAGLITSCRNTVEEPSPLGPSTFSILLRLSANPNTIFAGMTTRQSTAVTASLRRYDGSPVANKTVSFEAVDEFGLRVNVGFFEGNEPVLTKATDSSGQVNATYYGPFREEIPSSGSIYIRATVAWEGSEFIVERTPLYIIRDSDDLTIAVEAEPDILYSTGVAPKSVITAIVTQGGAPLSDCPVYFSILTGWGRFEDTSRSTYQLSNAEGIATVVYVGPKKGALTGLISVDETIRVQVSDTAFKDITIRIIRER